MIKINKQLSYAPADLQISYCGWASPAMQQLQDTFKKQLTLLCYDKAKSVEELSEALQTPREFILDAVTSMTRIKMMRELDGKYLTLFPMLHTKKKEEGLAITYRYNQEHKIPKRLNDLLFSLKDKIAALGFYGKAFDISYLNWFLYTVTSNCMIAEFRSYFSDKTDEVVLNKDAWKTANYDFSVCASYTYADEKNEPNNSEAHLCKTSTVYNRLGGIQFNNVFDTAPFPSWYNTKNHICDYNAGRNLYLTSENINFYLKLVKGNTKDFTEEEKKWLEEFMEHGVVEKSSTGYKPMIPVFTNEVFDELEKIITKAVIPIVREIAEVQNKNIEEIVLPEMHGVKERIDQMYVFWLCYFLCPQEELYWYGMNVEGLSIPADYKKSAAGLYIIR